jgi:hypothetical protein
MKAKDHQEDFNLKLMKIPDRIEKKLDKKSGSSKSGSHKSPEEKERLRSGGRHHYHSQNHSHRRSHSSSSPSPIRKHRRYGVDELKGQMNNIKPPTFDGEHKKGEDVETWILGMRKYLQLHNYQLNCHLSTERKGINVVGSAGVSATPQREKCDLEGIQEAF